MADAVKDLKSACHEYVVDRNAYKQQLIAYKLASCYRQMGGFEPLECSYVSNISKHALKHCINRLSSDKSGILLQLFVDQLGRTQDIC